MAANPMNNKNLGRTHSKELAKNNRGKRTRKNSDYQTAATAARQAQAQSQAAQKAPWPTKVKVTLGIMFGVLVACLVVRLAAGKPDPQQRHHPAAGSFLRRAVSDPQGLPRPQALEAGRRGQRRSDRVRPGIRPSGRLGPSAAVRVKLSRPVPPLSREFPVDNRDRACYIEE